MNIVVLGATGGIGREVVEQAVASGHHVTAVIRGTVPAGDNPQLQVVRADVTDAAALRPVVVGADAVISALGHRKGGSTDLCADVATALVDAAPAQTRVLLVGASAMYSDGGDRPWTRWLAKPLLRWILRVRFADTARMEAIAASSSLAWTVVRPSRLTDGKRTGSYRSAVDCNLRGGAKISRADVAVAMLRMLEDPLTVRHGVYVAY